MIEGHFIFRKNVYLRDIQQRLRSIHLRFLCYFSSFQLKGNTFLHSEFLFNHLACVCAGGRVSRADHGWQRFSQREPNDLQRLCPTPGREFLQRFVPSHTLTFSVSDHDKRFIVDCLLCLYFKCRPPDLTIPSTRVLGSRWMAATTSTNNPMTPGEVTALHTRVFKGFIIRVTCHPSCFMRAESEGLDRSPPEPTKEKEKQGFFRSMKKKKKKSQTVSLYAMCVCVLYFMCLCVCKGPNPPCMWDPVNYSAHCVSVWVLSSCIADRRWWRRRSCHEKTSVSSFLLSEELHAELFWEVSPPSGHTNGTRVSSYCTFTVPRHISNTT